jgi:hypothetical protein
MDTNTNYDRLPTALQQMATLFTGQFTFSTYQELGDALECSRQNAERVYKRLVDLCPEFNANKIKKSLKKDNPEKDFVNLGFRLDETLYEQLPKKGKGQFLREAFDAYLNRGCRSLREQRGLYLTENPATDDDLSKTVNVRVPKETHEQLSSLEGSISYNIRSAIIHFIDPKAPVV